MVIRSGTIEDAEKIAQLTMTAMSDDCCRYFYGNKYTSDDFLRVMTNMVRQKDSQYSYYNTICAVEDNKVVGISVSYDGKRLTELRQCFIKTMLKEFNRDFSNMPDETSEGELYLDSLAVDSDYRGRGFAKELLKATKQKAMSMGIDKLGLLVDVNNPSAEKLYVSVGFSFVNQNRWGGHDMKHFQW
ncbi:MAG: GNAT family N-acetyltransferase [Marinilabiliaceae bacterium]|nr:GNAT family N-acetyltransferase [Marinilabiliaceae bacterium]